MRPYFKDLEISSYMPFTLNDCSLFGQFGICLLFEERPCTICYFSFWCINCPRHTGMRFVRICNYHVQVYVPVVDNGHWWCVAFALKDQKIWFIDSMYTNPASEHSGDVKKLVSNHVICSFYLVFT